MNEQTYLALSDRFDALMDEFMDTRDTLNIALIRPVCTEDMVIAEMHRQVFWYRFELACRAAGLTTEDFELEIERRLDARN